MRNRSTDGSPRQLVVNRRRLASDGQYLLVGWCCAEVRANRTPATGFPFGITDNPQSFKTTFPPPPKSGVIFQQIRATNQGTTFSRFSDVHAFRIAFLLQELVGWPVAEPTHRALHIWTFSMKSFCPFRNTVVDITVDHCQQMAKSGCLDPYCNPFIVQ